MTPRCGPSKLRRFCSRIAYWGLALCAVAEFLNRFSHDRLAVEKSLQTETEERCKPLTVRTNVGLQSSLLSNCKTDRISLQYVCVPLCGSSAFQVNLSASAGSDEVQELNVRACQVSPLSLFSRKSSNVEQQKILVVFKMTRVFNGHHLYHVLNNFVVNLDPAFLDLFAFHCWGCEVTFSNFFDRVLNINSRIVTKGCFAKFIFLGEHYSTYDLDLGDVEKRIRWRHWASYFRQTWCTSEALSWDERYTTLLRREGANNGRNMHNCFIQNSSTSKEVVPTLNNVAETCDMICQSKTLISAEGNGLTNMILMQPDSLVTVIWQSNRPLDGLRVIYGNMAKLLGMHMVAIPVESDESLNANCSRVINQIMSDVM